MVATGIIPRYNARRAERRGSAFAAILPVDGSIMRLHLTNRILLALTTFLAPIVLPEAHGVEAKSDNSPFKRLKFRSIGPAAGGRVCRVAGVPGDPLTCYAATAASGVWKSSDGGIHWRPI